MSPDTLLAAGIPVRSRLFGGLSWRPRHRQPPGPFSKPANSQRHRARLRLATTDRHGACGNAHTSCRVGHDRRAVEINIGDSSTPSKRRQPCTGRVCTRSTTRLEPLKSVRRASGSGPPARGGDRANPRCDDYMWSLPCKLAPACVLNAPVMATYSPGVVASIQGQERALDQDVESEPKRRHPQALLQPSGA